jgi:hypothetical protein
MWYSLLADLNTAKTSGLGWASAAKLLIARAQTAGWNNYEISALITALVVEQKRLESFPGSRGIKRQPA